MPAGPLRLLALLPLVLPAARGVYFAPGYGLDPATGQLVVSGAPYDPAAAAFLYGTGEVSEQHTAFAPLTRQDLVRPLLANVSVERMEKDLWALTGFHTRDAHAENGRTSQVWLREQIEKVVGDFAPAIRGSSISVREFEHPWPQNTIIARFNGTSDDDSLVILGAHQDSLNYKDHGARSPGADDDGSGTVTLLEAFRLLVSGNFTPSHPVEFHWYAAEEGGLLGSRGVVAAYSRQGVKVKAMSQYDMTAWVKNDTMEAVGLITTDVDVGLTELHKQLVDEYVDIPYVPTRIPAGVGSDHMPWHFEGYPACYISEGAWGDWEPYVHTPNDRIDISPEFSFKHMAQFVKLAVSFAIEIGGWESK